MSLETIEQCSLDRANGLSPASGAALLLSFFIGAHYWGNLIDVNFSPIYFRMVFLAFFILMVRRKSHISIQHMIGRLDLPRGSNLRWLALAAAAAIVARLSVKLWSHSIDPADDFETLTLDNFILECILPPLSEEPVFRGVLLTALCAIFREKVGAVIVFSALIFAGVHDIHYPPQQLSTFLFGSISTVLSLRTRSLSSCMFLHAFSNTFIFF